MNLRVPTVDALCPFGALEGLWHLLTTGRFLGKLFPSNIVVGLALLVSVVVAAGAFCGWVCPFGTLQDGLQALRRRLRLPSLTVPHHMESYLRHVRFLVLAGILWVTIGAAELVFATICPYRTLFNMEWLFAPHSGALTAYVIALSILVASVFVKRFWCRFLCPLGAVISVVSLASVTRLRRTEESCTHCGLCDRQCPMNLTPQHETRVNPNCTMCLECSDACPHPNTLNPVVVRSGILDKYVKWVPGFTVVLFLAVILISNTMGVWRTGGMSQGYFAALATGERIHPEDIRGWMSIQDVSNVTGIPVAEIYARANLPEELEPNVPLSELERLVGFETDDMRDLFIDYIEEYPDVRPQPGAIVPTSPRGPGTGARNSPGQNQQAPAEVTKIDELSTLREVALYYDLALPALIEMLGLPQGTLGSSTLQRLGITPADVESLVQGL